MTTLAQANTDLSNLNRNPNGLKTWVVKADGTLVTGGLSPWANDTASWGKTAVVHLQGGQMIVNGSINANFTDGASVNYVTFDAASSKFTAAFGGQLPDLAAVQAAIGSGLNFRPVDNTLTLNAADNGNGTFTITAAAAVVELPTSGSIRK